MPRRRPRDDRQERLDLRARGADLAIGYCRVSSREAARDGLSLTVQARRIRDYAAACGLKLVEVLADPGVSAGRPIARRPAGKRVVGAIEGGEVSVVIAVRLDRLFRNTVDCLESVASWRGGGVAIHLVDDGGPLLDTTTPMGEALLALRAVFAQMERSFASTRVKDIVRHKREAGLHQGGKVPLGFRVDAAGRLIEDAAEQECLRLMREMWADGRGMRPWAIYRHLLAHVPHPRGSNWTYEGIKRHLPGWRPGYSRERTAYSDALHRRVIALRDRGVALPDIGREMIRDGYEPIGERFWTGSLSKISRKG
jgi:DNA invertase Pin-like site-specific DNA recombinase